MSVFPEYEIWVVVGSQHLYGPEALEQVRANAATVAEGLAGSGRLPVPVVGKGIVTTATEVSAICREASADQRCIGVMVWMHTFSPAQMWLEGLQLLTKPVVHLHTQLGSALPWDSIDMDFMNLHQSAHGGREFGHACARLGLQRTVVVGHWQSQRVQDEIALWQRAAVGRAVLRTTKVARFGDNMRSVAVTEGDKVQARIDLGIAVDGYGVGDLVDVMQGIDETAVDETCAACDAAYELVSELRVGGERRHSLREQVRMELALRAFLDAGGYTAFTDTFEDLHGLPQLPGLAAQRLMADGYGFGAEGDWKTAALLRACKVMARGLDGGTSFMEDYTYDFGEEGMLVLGAHMLEICPSIADAARGKPRAEIHPLGIGGKADPVRLVFDAPAGDALNASLIDQGCGLRLLLNTVEGIAPTRDLPHLPVARALWRAHPDLPTAAAAWIHAGGAHHTVYTQALGPEHLQSLADLCGIECLLIDEGTELRAFTRDLQRKVRAAG